MKIVQKGTAKMFDTEDKNTCADLKQSEIVRIMVICEEYSNEYSVKLKEGKSFEDAAIDAMCTDLAGEYDYIFEEAQDGYSYPSDEECNIARITESLSTAIKQCIDEYTREDIVQIKELDNKGNTIRSFEVNLNEVLKRAVDLLFEGSYSHVTFAVEGYLYDLESKGKWHIGLLHHGSVITNTSLLQKEAASHIDFDNEDYKPFAWFGTSDRIVKPWIIYWNMEQDELEFWQESDPWLKMQYIIGEKNEPFLWEYLWEKACEVPDTNEILERCPINFLVSDTVEEVNRKLKDYFAQIMSGGSLDA